jgi:hypothetical protein
MTDHISPVYKIVKPDGTTPQGYGKWDIPQSGKPGRWQSVGGELVACHNGLHLLRTADLTEWLPEPPALVLLAEYTGSAVVSDDKIVVRRARAVAVVGELTERIYHLLACDYAERVLPIFEKERPDDKRPRQAIETKLRWVASEATSEELAAAGDAAWAAARDAAGAAAWAAAWAAARDAAGAAAWAAARDAARAAAWAAAWAAARDAARAAAWAAARAAARDAARDAARAAAWDAAGDAERQWQGERLIAYLRGIAP